MIFAIDPGTEQSAYVLFDGSKPLFFDILDNSMILNRIACDTASSCLVVESVESFGMPVGREVFETCIWIGRFIERWRLLGPARLRPHHLIGRRAVKLHLCNSARAKDAHVRQSLIDRFGPGREAAIGKKKTPGPCYGIRDHMWSALAVAVTAADTLDPRDVAGSDIRRLG